VGSTSAFSALHFLSFNLYGVSGNFKIPAQIYTSLFITSILFCRTVLVCFCDKGCYLTFLLSVQVARLVEILNLDIVFS